MATNPIAACHAETRRLAGEVWGLVCRHANPGPRNKRRSVPLSEIEHVPDGITLDRYGGLPEDEVNGEQRYLDFRAELSTMLEGSSLDYAGAMQATKDGDVRSRIDAVRESMTVFISHALGGIVSHELSVAYGRLPVVLGRLEQFIDAAVPDEWSDYKSPSEWCRLIDKSESHFRSVWKKEFKGENHPVSNAKLVRFPVDEMKRAGVPGY